MAKRPAAEAMATLEPKAPAPLPLPFPGLALVVLLAAPPPCFVAEAFTAEAVDFAAPALGILVSKALVLDVAAVELGKELESPPLVTAAPVSVGNDESSVAEGM